MGLIELDVCERLWRKYLKLMNGRKVSELSTREKEKLLILIKKADKAINREADRGSKRPPERWKKWADLYKKMIYEHWAYGDSNSKSRSK